MKLSRSKLLIVVVVELLVAAQTLCIPHHKTDNQKPDGHQLHIQQFARLRLLLKPSPHRPSNASIETAAGEHATASGKRATPLGAGCSGWGPGCATGRAGARREAAVGSWWRRRVRPTFHFSLVSDRRRWHPMDRKRAALTHRRVAARLTGLFHPRQ